MAFEETTKIIGGRNRIFSLSDGWSLDVERAEVPLLKMIVLLPKVVATIGEQETGDVFETRIDSTANHLVDNYGSIEH
jgi:hypothetical protein